MSRVCDDFWHSLTGEEQQAYVSEMTAREDADRAEWEAAHPELALPALPAQPPRLPRPYDLDLDVPF